MGDLSKNLSRSEVACKCGCGRDTIDYETVEAFQECCDHFKFTMGMRRVVANIHSGFRCVEHNDKEGGGLNSQHLQGKALDFDIEDIKPSAVYSYLSRKYPDKYGIGYYKTFTHLDSRDCKARW